MAISADHNCINLRCRPMAVVRVGSSKKQARELKVRVEGQLIFNGTAQMLNAALAGFGLA